MGSKYILVRQEYDWSDEFSVYGVMVAERETVNEGLGVIKLAFADGHITEDNEFYFGTNEALTFIDYDQFEAGLTVESVTDEFAEEFQRLMPHGHGEDFISRILDRLGEDEDEDY